MTDRARACPPSSSQTIGAGWALYSTRSQGTGFSYFSDWDRSIFYLNWQSIHAQVVFYCNLLLINACILFFEKCSIIN